VNSGHHLTLANANATRDGK